jgi:hypothetical protein
MAELKKGKIAFLPDTRIGDHHFRGFAFPNKIRLRREITGAE